ncbi:503_t:CDS:2 [Acaulospora morrowiae]|uniref:503_t:CDS:1 n=1 Tax=Acaulospora morrowiae TaxID=94023 RepID=A0A9N9C6I3_9GLOM|nr:503_t:CDS:2 [Acaulospora morrowiae]
MSYDSEHYEPMGLKNIVCHFPNKALEKCYKCKKRQNLTYGFCPSCDFEPWTSGNQLVNEFIIKRQTRVEKHVALKRLTGSENYLKEFLREVRQSRNKGIPECADRKYGFNLATEIIGGLRLKFTEETPEKCRKIINACCDLKPEKATINEGVTAAILISYRQ